MSKEQELVLGWAVFGSFFTTVIMCAFILYVLTVIASWKIFTKAGLEGWKSLIPIYNAYLLYEIAGVNFWIYGLLIPFLSVFVQGIAGSINQEVIKSLIIIASSVVLIVAEWKFSKGLAASFGMRTGFAVGLLLSPYIFELILGFGSDKFQGTLE